MKSNATPIRCNRDSDSILAAVATSYDFCNTIGTFRKCHFRRPRAALGSKADSGKPPEAPFMSSRPSPLFALECPRARWGAISALGCLVSEGSVILSGVDLHDNFDALK